MKAEGSWVYWPKTVDQFLFGNPEIEIKGIAVAWMATFPTLKQAKARGCNLFVTHEPLYIRHTAYLEEDRPWVAKREWLETEAMTVLRCHDFWDDFPGIGIHGAWAKALGLTGEPVETDRFYEIHAVGSTTAGELAQRILEQVTKYNQKVVHLVGDPKTPVTKIGVGTGAITDYRVLHGMGADVLLLTDDGTKLWESGQWASDSGVPLILVNHATAEEPGMVTLARYLREHFPGIHVEHIPVGCLYTSFHV